MCSICYQVMKEVHKSHMILTLVLFKDTCQRSMDVEEFRSDPFQRVYQYLRRHVRSVSLDMFSYRPQSVEGAPAECLEVLLK